MKVFISIFFVLILINGKAHANKLDLAEQKAKTEHKFILLNFSGSDWCGPCIRMHKEILENEEFQKYSNSSLVYLNADFPRMKKHQFAAEIQKENEELAEKFNSEGTFPLTVLLDSNGKVIHKWEGFYANGPVLFTEEVKKLVENNR